ncbi:hypothetical protein F4775DRAFT_308375 [Biscogniauxia sp. FL1348]|nr:hypothetical protein F4775DRAFT_308375 [Biscogniauxia sp. FL1348]
MVAVLFPNTAYNLSRLFLKSKAPMSNTQSSRFAPSNPFRTPGNVSRATGNTNTHTEYSARSTNMWASGTSASGSPSRTSPRVQFSATSTAHNLDGSTATVATNLPSSNSSAAPMNDQESRTATASTQTSPHHETAAAAATTSTSAPLPQPTPSPTGPPNTPPPVPPAPPSSSAAPSPSDPPAPPPGQQVAAPYNQPGPNHGNVPFANMGGPNITIVSPPQVPFLWYNCPIMAPSNPQGQTNHMAMRKLFSFSSFGMLVFSPATPVYNTGSVILGISERKRGKEKQNYGLFKLIELAFPQATQNPNAPIHLGTSHFLTSQPPPVYAAQHAYVPQVATYTNITAPNGPVYVIRGDTSGNTSPVILYYM